MIAYLVHTGVVSDGRIGRMGIASGYGTRHHSDTSVETSCTSLSFQMSPNKVQAALFSPLTLHIGTSGDDSVGLIIHAGEVRDEKAVGKAKSKCDVRRFRVQFGC